MGGGGKGGGNFQPDVAPTYTDPVNGKSFTSSDDLNNEINTRTAQSTIDTTSANQEIIDQNTANQQTFLQQAAAAKAQATQNMNDYFRQQGVDPTKYSDQIANAINTESNNLVNPGAYSAGMGNSTPTSSTVNGVTTTSATTPATLINYSGDPSSVYTSTAGSDLYNQLQSGAQSQALQGYNSLFAPSYSQTALSDSLIDPAVSNVLSSQFDPLSAQLSNAQKRGTLNDQGYQAALTALTGDQTNARSSVSKLAQGVLNSDRSDLDSYIGTGRTAAGSVPLGTSFDSSPYQSGASDLASRDISNFGGDVSNAVGNTSYGDLTSLLNTGGAVQGANDPTAANPTGAVSAAGGAIGGGDLSPTYIAQQALAKDPRGLGTTGAF